MNGGSSAASGSSSITTAGSLLLPSVPGGTGVAVDDPSPLTLGSSTAPPGGTGSMTGGGGSGVVGAGMLPLVDLPSSAAATLADVENAATPPAFEPEVTNTSRAPLALMRASRLGPGRLPPPGATLSRLVSPVRRSRRKMSRSPLVSPATRFVAADSKATKRPSCVIEARVLSPPAASASADDTLTRSVATNPGSSITPSPSTSRSRTKTSRRPLPSAARFVAAESNAT